MVKMIISLLLVISFTMLVRSFDLRGKEQFFLKDLELLKERALAARKIRNMAAMSQEDLEKGCGNNPADITFVLDESGSIWGPDFDKQLVFVNDVASVFDITQGKTHLGVMTFADDSLIHFHMGSVNSMQQLQQQLKQIKQRRGGTKTFEAIEDMADHMFDKSHSRGNVPHLCILITDGESENTDLTAASAQRAKDMGITMFAIGVGKSVNRAELEAIASKPTKDYVHTVDSYSALKTLRDILAWTACQVTTLPPPTTPTTITTTTTTTPKPTTTLPQMIEGCSDRYPMDVLFSIPDQAGIVGTEDCIEFIESIVGQTELSPVQVQVGVTPRFCDRADSINLKQHDTLDGFAMDLADRRYSSTRTEKHLEYMYTEGMNRKNGARDEAAKFGILIIDNKSRNRAEALKQAKQAKRNGIDLIVIGVGDYVSLDELNEIATDPDSVYWVQNYNELLTMTDTVMDRLCQGLREYS